MIKFFRMIRQNLLMENKTSKYFKYAIGEIFLVVIGILIAVAINSKYHEAQNKTKIDTILSQIQNDLLIDIIDAERIYDVKMEKDSLARKIFFSTLTEEEYLTKPYPLNIAGNYVSFTTQKGSYSRLMQNLENLPDKYQYLLPLFNNLYIEMQNDIDDYNEYIKNTVMVDNRNHLLKNPKTAEYNLGLLSREEGLKFLFNDPLLKNRIWIYMNDISNISNTANDYKVEAIKLYKQIDSIKGKNSNITKLKTLPKQEFMLPFVGTYKEIDDLTGTLEYTIEIKQDHILSKSLEEDIKLYWHKDDYFYRYQSDGSYKFYKNKHGQRIIRFSNALTVREFINQDDINLKQ